MVTLRFLKSAETMILLRSLVVVETLCRRSAGAYDCDGAAEVEGQGVRWKSEAEAEEAAGGWCSPKYPRNARNTINSHNTMHLPALPGQTGRPSA